MKWKIEYINPDPAKAWIVTYVVTDGARRFQCDDEDAAAWLLTLLNNLQG